ncbi:UbiX family flavin prenyltransferase [Streptococcus caprae]|uniref:Flavin prenyltransferase UbiX n=1 Tax=Streptococcus caprae TaxID=1640501 RepID=A0ABV8CTN8_9STRE
MTRKKRIIVAISGASGTIYAINLLRKLKANPDIETHVVMSDWARENLKIELDMSHMEFESLCDVLYSNKNLGAKIASGSFITDGMVVVPASMKTVAGIACGFSDNLIGRAADVILKEQRKLILVPRETPLNTIHLENLTKLSKMGVHIIPPVPAFYNKPETIQDIIDHNTYRLMDALGIENDYGHRWEG